MKIAVLVLDRVFDTGLATLLDTLALANAIAASEGIVGARFDVSLVGVRRKVVTGQGMRVPVGRIEACPQPDVALLPALNNKTTDAVCESLGRRDVADAGAQLKAWSALGAVLGAACNATFVLAENKLLDGQGGDDHLVARTALSRTLPAGGARRVAHAGAVGQLRHRGRGAGAPRPGAVVRAARQPDTGDADGALSGDGPAPVAGRVRDQRPPGP